MLPQVAARARRPQVSGPVRAAARQRDHMIDMLERSAAVRAGTAVERDARADLFGCRETTRASFSRASQVTVHDPLLAIFRVERARARTSIGSQCGLVLVSVVPAALHRANVLGIASVLTSFRLARLRPSLRRIRGAPRRNRFSVAALAPRVQAVGVAAVARKRPGRTALRAAAVQRGAGRRHRSETGGVHGVLLSTDSMPRRQRAARPSNARSPTSRHDA